MLKSFVEIRVQLRFEHKWTKAPKHRKYLREFHPHNFTFRLELEVFETDREIEFHDLQDWLYETVFENVDGFRLDSCETMAMKILQIARERFWGDNRSIEVEVWEDQDTGGKVQFTPPLEVDLENIEQGLEKGVRKRSLR